MKPTYRPPVRDEDRIRAQLTLSLVSSATGIAVDAPNSRTRLSGPVSRARWAAMYLTHVAFGWPLERVGDVFGLNRSTAAKACRWAEDERDRPAFDRLLTRLEVYARMLSAPVKGALA